MVSSRIFCLGGKNSLESLTTPTFVDTLYWHVFNLFTDFYGKEQTLSFEGNAGVSKPDVDPDQAEAEWKIFRRILFTQHRSESGLQKIVTTFLGSSAFLVAGFPNLASLARLAVVLPVTTATVE